MTHLKLHADTSMLLASRLICTLLALRDSAPTHSTSPFGVRLLARSTSPQYSTIGGQPLLSRLRILK